MNLILGDYIEFISGPAFKSKNFTDNSDDIPLVKGDNLAQGYIKWEKSKYWPVKDTEQYEKYYLYPGDIVLAMDRPWVTAGLKFARIKENDPQSLVVQRVARLRATNGMTQDFLHSLVGSKSFEEYIKNIMGGTNVPHISPAQIKAYDFNVDKFSFEKIGLIYKTYTDLIENNRRRIQLLEESTRLLYQEWFVHLRFPGHEQVKITDGVPEGWIESTLGSLASVQSGYAFKSKDWLEAGNPVIKIKNITGDGTVDIADCQCVDDNVVEKAQRFKLEEGDFLIAMTGATVGKVGIMPRTNQPYFLNQRVGKFEFVGETSREFVFCLVNTKHFRNQIENLAGGAAQPNISGKQIESIKVLRPSYKLLSFFSEQTHNLFEQRQLLVESNKKLAQARDLLLPKLMSGELTI